MHLVLELFGGLGLFFIGIKLLGDNLRQMTGQRFRGLVERATRHPVLAALLGCASGAITQSTSAMTFIVVALSTAGAVDTRKAIPLLVWANVGTAGLVLIATMDSHGMAFFLLGAIGLGYFADAHKAAHWRHGIAACLGIGLLFLGLTVMKDSAGPIQNMPAVRDALATAAAFPLLGLAAGTLLALIAQSSATVSVIAVTLVNAGLLTMEQATMVIYGAGLGSGLAVWLLSSTSRGLAAQLVLLQVVCKALGALVLVPLFFLEQALDLPLALAAARFLAGTPAEQAAVLFLLYQVVAAGLVSLTQGPLFCLIQRVFPATPMDSLSRPQFLMTDALQEPDSALDLVNQEQARLLSVSLAVLDHHRPGEVGDPTLAALPRPALRDAGLALAGEIERYLDRLIDQDLTPGTLERAVRAQNRLLLMVDLKTAIVTLAEAMASKTQAPDLATLHQTLIESLHFALDLLREETLALDPMGLDALVTVTADRSDMMERWRRDLLTLLGQGDPAALDLVFLTTAQFERAVWLIHRSARLLREDLIALDG